MWHGLENKSNKRKSYLKKKRRCVILTWSLTLHIIQHQDNGQLYTTVQTNLPSAETKATLHSMVQFKPSHCRHTCSFKREQGRIIAGQRPEREKRRGNHPTQPPQPLTTDESYFHPLHPALSSDFKFGFSPGAHVTVWMRLWAPFLACWSFNMPSWKHQWSSTRPSNCPKTYNQPEGRTQEAPCGRGIILAVWCPVDRVCTQKKHQTTDLSGLYLEIVKLLNAYCCNWCLI